MAYQRYGQHDKSYICDTFADLKEIKDPNCSMGSTCFVIDEAIKYMINSKGEWIKQAPTITESSGSGSNTPNLSSYATISYVNEKIDAIEIPSVENLASESYVDEAIAAINPIKDGYGEAHTFGLMVDSSENRTLIDAMLEKGKVGMYNFHVEKGCPGQPLEVAEKNSSCRGIACIDTYYSNSNWYGWIIMFDHDGEMYTQYIRGAEPKGWKRTMTI